LNGLVYLESITVGLGRTARSRPTSDCRQAASPSERVPINGMPHCFYAPGHRSRRRPVAAAQWSFSPRSPERGIANLWLDALDVEWSLVMSTVDATDNSDSAKLTVTRPGFDCSHFPGQAVNIMKSYRQIDSIGNSHELSHAGQMRGRAPKNLHLTSFGSSSRIFRAGSLAASRIPSQVTHNIHDIEDLCTAFVPQLAASASLSRLDQEIFPHPKERGLRICR
jgi:hypothetical protein